MRFIIKRYRQSEGAPSLSLGYKADNAYDALVKHFERYPADNGYAYAFGVPKGTPEMSDGTLVEPSGHASGGFFDNYAITRARREACA